MIDAVLILHIAVAAAWFGHKLLIPRDVRSSVRDPANAAFLIPRVGRAQRLGIVSGLATLGTGIWLMYLITGFSDVRTEIYVAAVAVIAMLVVGAVVETPAWRRIKEAIAAGDTPGAVAAVSGFNRAINLESLLWILALVMMII